MEDALPTNVLNFIRLRADHADDKLEGAVRGEIEKSLSLLNQAQRNLSDQEFRLYAQLLVETRAEVVGGDVDLAAVKLASKLGV